LGGTGGMLWGEGVEGEEEHEGGAGGSGALGAADAEATAVALDDLLADPEAEAGAVESLGAEEGLEDARGGCGGHAGAVVCNGDDETLDAGVVVAGFSAAEQDAAAVGAHRVDGVAEEVADDLADFSFVAEDGAARVVAYLDGDVGVDEAALVDAEDLAEELVAGEFSGSGGLFVEAERLVGDGGDALQLSLGDVEIFAGLE
jgi:hypothetical protein